LYFNLEKQFVKVKENNLKILFKIKLYEIVFELGRKVGGSGEGNDIYFNFKASSCFLKDV